MHASNNLTFNEAMEILKSAESALEAAENAYEVNNTDITLLWTYCSKNKIKTNKWLLYYQETS